MKFQDVKVGNHRIELEVHPAADAFPLLDGPEFDAFVEDVRKNGFRDPAVIKDRQLIDGRNRLRAGKKLGIDPPLKLLDRSVDVLDYIISTNIHRRHLTESQRSLIAATLATLEQGTNRHSKGKVAAPTQAGAAARLQVSERSVRDARRVLASGAPELVDAVKNGRVAVSAAAELSKRPKSEQQRILKQVSGKGGEVKPGKVVALSKQAAKRETLERINTGQVRPMGIGPFGLIVVDYPWPYMNSDTHEGSRGHMPYPPMGLLDITQHARNDVAKAAAVDAILALWVTNAFIPLVGEVIQAAGFIHRTMITWDKLRAGVGTWPRGQTEHLVIASRGNPVHTLNQITTYHAEERREHSRKPDRLMAALAKHCAGPHLEMFAREERDGWVSWGAEVGKFTPRSAPAAAPPAPSLADACPKCGRELGEHQGKKCPRPPSPPAVAPVDESASAELDEVLAEPWTCRDCGHVNTFRILDGIVEVCGNCEVERPRTPEPAPSSATTWTCAECGGANNVRDFIEACGECGCVKLPSVPAAEQLAEPWTCRARPDGTDDGAQCGHINTVPTYEGIGGDVEVCGKCGCTRGTWGNGRPQPTPVADEADAGADLAELAEPDPEPEIERFEPWTCRARPTKRGGECGYLNTFRVVRQPHNTEVCGDCGCPRPLHGSPGKPAKAAKATKPATVAKHEASFQAARSRRRPLSAPPAPRAAKRRPLSVPPEAPAACGLRMTMAPTDRGKPEKRKPPHETCELAAGHDGDHRAHARASKHIVEWKGDGSKGCVWVPLKPASGECAGCRRGGKCAIHGTPVKRRPGRVPA